MVPMELPGNDQQQHQEQPFYQPPPPPMGYPPHPSGNPYAVPHQNADGNFNPYAPQYQMPYPPAQPNPPFNPYQVKEGN